MEAREPEKYEREWKAMRKKSMGELLEFSARGSQSPYTKRLADAELERRTFARDKRIDRWCSFIAIGLSAAALSVSVVRCTASTNPRSDRQAPTVTDP